MVADMITYELTLTVTARDGLAATTPLLPLVLMSTSNDLLEILIQASYMAPVANNPLEGQLASSLYELSEKVKQDVLDDKYKWHVEKRK